MDEVSKTLVAAGIDPDHAASEAEAVCRRLRHEWGGGEYYIPSVDKADDDRRIAEDVARLKDRQRVARLHGVHESTVSRAVTRHNRRKRNPSTGFGDSDWVL